MPNSTGASVSLCLLTLNEVSGCRHDVPLLPLDEFDEVYAVDGGSEDGTVEYLKSQGIKVIEQPIRGYNHGYICAFYNCSSDTLVVFHPKASILDARSLRPFYCSSTKGTTSLWPAAWARALATRRHAGMLRPRKWFVLALGWLSSVLWRRGSMSNLGRIARLPGNATRSLLRCCADRTYFTLDLQMIVRGDRQGFRMAEFPVQERKRPFGKTHFAAIPTGWRYLVYLSREIRRSE